MIVKNKDQRVAVLVDVQNMYYSAKNLYDQKVNFKSILTDTVGERSLIRAMAYVIRADVGKEEAFFEALYEAGFDIKEKDLQTFAGGGKKGDWDVGITMDAIRFAEKVDSIILVSGDGDFRPLVEYLSLAKGCLVELVAFGRTCNGDLKESVDTFLDLESDKKRYLIPNRRRPSKNYSSNRPSLLGATSLVASPEVKVEIPKPMNSVVVERTKNSPPEVVAVGNEKLTEPKVSNLHNYNVKEKYEQKPSINRPGKGVINITKQGRGNFK